jgi:ABC-type molybdate transport system substrate-binding protein
VTASVAVALALAFIASAALAQPIPALVPIALVASAGVPAFRTLAPKDRKVAGFAVALAVGVVVLVALRS